MTRVAQPFTAPRNRVCAIRIGPFGGAGGATNTVSPAPNHNRLVRSAVYG